jgi:hypothetical protein
MSNTKMIRVVAIARGFDGVSLREPGEEFTMPESAMTAKVENEKDVLGKETGKKIVIPPSWFKPVKAGQPAVLADDLA